MITRYKSTLIQTLLNHLVEQGGEITMRGSDRDMTLVLRREVRGFNVGGIYIRLIVSNPTTDYHKDLLVLHGTNTLALQKLINRFVFKETLETAIAQYDGLGFPLVQL